MLSYLEGRCQVELSVEEVRRQDFEREILHGCQKDSQGGDERSLREF